MLSSLRRPLPARNFELHRPVNTHENVHVCHVCHVCHAVTVTYLLFSAVLTQNCLHVLKVINCDQKIIFFMKNTKENSCYASLPTKTYFTYRPYFITAYDNGKTGDTFPYIDIPNIKIYHLFTTFYDHHSTVFCSCSFRCIRL